MMYFRRLNDGNLSAKGPDTRAETASEALDGMA